MSETVLEEYGFKASMMAPGQMQAAERMAAECATLRARVAELEAQLATARADVTRLREVIGGLMPPRCASLVEVSNEMAAQLLGEPSQPVTIRLERRADGRVELLCARHECTPTPEPPHA